MSLADRVQEVTIDSLGWPGECYAVVRGYYTDAAGRWCHSMRQTARRYPDRDAARSAGLRLAEFLHWDRVPTTFRPERDQ